MDLVSTLIWIAIILIVLGLSFFLVAKQYRKVGPNEVLIISGGRKKTVTGPDGSTKESRVSLPAGRRDICLALIGDL